MREIVDHRVADSNPAVAPKLVVLHCSVVMTVYRHQIVVLHIVMARAKDKQLKSAPYASGQSETEAVAEVVWSLLGNQRPTAMGNEMADSTEIPWNMLQAAVSQLVVLCSGVTRMKVPVDCFLEEDSEANCFQPLMQKCYVQARRSCFVYPKAQRFAYSFDFSVARWLALPVPESVLYA